MKSKFIIYLFLLVLVISSCSPYISTTVAKQVPPVSNFAKVEMYNFYRDMPPNATYLGNVFVGDRGSTTNCGYDVMLNLVKLETRKMGGNAILIKNHFKPGLMSSCHQFDVEVYNTTTGVANNRPSDTIPATNNRSFEVVDENQQTNYEITKDNAIHISKGPFGYKYSLAGEPLSLTQLEILLQKNPNAYKLYNSARNSIVPSSILGYLSGYCLGYGLTSLLFYKSEAGLPIAGIGAGLLLITVPIVKSAESKLKKSIDIYNMDVKGTSCAEPYSIHLSSSANGVGVVFRF